MFGHKLTNRGSLRTMLERGDLWIENREQELRATHNVVYYLDNLSCYLIWVKMI